MKHLRGFFAIPSSSRVDPQGARTTRAKRSPGRAGGCGCPCPNQIDCASTFARCEQGGADAPAQPKRKAGMDAITPWMNALHYLLRQPACRPQGSGDGLVAVFRCRHPVSPGVGGPEGLPSQEKRCHQTPGNGDSIASNERQPAHHSNRAVQHTGLTTWPGHRPHRGYGDLKA